MASNSQWLSVLFRVTATRATSGDINMPTCVFHSHSVAVPHLIVVAVTAAAVVIDVGVRVCPLPAP